MINVIEFAKATALKVNSHCGGNGNGKDLKTQFFNCRCHCSVNTVTRFHDIYFFHCRCCHEWVMNPFVTAKTMTQKMPLPSQCERALQYQYCIPNVIMEFKHFYTYFKC